MMIYEGDTIYTSENSFIILKASDFSVHRIEENTKLFIEKTPSFIGDDTTQVDEPAVMQIIHGAIFNEVVRKYDSESLQVKSSNVVFGVRGTKFLVSKNQEDNDVVISVDSGEVEVENQYTNSTEFIEPSETMLIEKDFNFTKKQKIKDFLDKKDWDLTDLKAKRSEFRSRRKVALKKLRERRQKWQPNKERIQKKKEAWRARAKKWQERRKLRKLKNFKGDKAENSKLKNKKNRLRKRQQMRDIRDNVQDRNEVRERLQKRRLRKRRRQAPPPSGEQP